MGLRVAPEEMAALESWIAAEPGEFTHAQAIRRLTTWALRQLGHFGG